MKKRYWIAFATKIESDDMEMLNVFLQKNKIETEMVPFDGKRAYIYVDMEKYVQAINLGVKFILDNDLYGEIDVCSPLGNGIHYQREILKVVENNLFDIYGTRDIKSKKEDIEFDDDKSNGLVC